MKTPMTVLHRDSALLASGAHAEGEALRLFAGQANGIVTKSRAQSTGFEAKNLVSNEVFECVAYGITLRGAALDTDTNALDQAKIADLIEVSLHLEQGVEPHPVGLVRQCGDLSRVAANRNMATISSTSDVVGVDIGRDGMTTPRLLPAPHTVRSGDTLQVHLTVAEALTLAADQIVTVHLYGRRMYV